MTEMCKDYPNVSEYREYILRMETVHLRSVTLSNFEVMRFLQEQRDEMNQQKGNRKEKKKRRVNKSLLTVTVETLAWLESQPASVQSEEIIKSFLDKLKTFESEENVRYLRSQILRKHNLNILL